MLRKMMFMVAALLLIAGAFGCEGDKGDRGINGHAVVSTTEAIATTDLDTCPAGKGGTAVIIVSDVNDNNAYDSTDPILSTANICTAADGAPGESGTNGHSIISATTSVPVTDTTTCPAGTGGAVVEFYLDLDDDGAIDLADPKDTALQTVTLCNGATPAPFSITGVVTDKTGMPLEGATITLVGNGATATTSAEGAFGFEVLAAGTYTLSASLTGYTFTDTQTATVSSTQNGTVTFASNEATKPLTLVITPASFSLIVDTTQQLTATATYTAGGPDVDVTNFVTWNSVKPSAVTVSETGLVTAVTLDDVSQITAELGGLLSEAITVTVVAAQ